jgi:hypothetical protein
MRRTDYVISLIVVLVLACSGVVAGCAKKRESQKKKSSELSNSEIEHRDLHWPDFVLVKTTNGNPLSSSWKDFSIWVEPRFLDVLSFGSHRPVAGLTQGMVQKSSKLGNDSASFLIEPLMEHLKDIAKKQKALNQNDRGEATSAATIFLHPDIPYQTITEIMYTAGMSEYSEFRFVVSSDQQRKVFVVEMPKLRPRKPTENQPLNLIVQAVEEGFRVIASGTTEPTVLKKQGGKYDYPGLTRLIASIKSKHPKEDRVRLAADFDMPWRVVARTMDTVYPKFPKFTFMVAE